MKVSSSSVLPTYQVLGNKLLIHWNEQVVMSTGMDGEPTTSYEYNEASAFVYDTRELLIEKIIGSVYTVGAEIAAIRNGGQDADDHHALRVQAKALADGWLKGGK